MPIRSVLSEEKKLYMAALSQTLPDRLIEQATPLSAIKTLELLARILSGFGLNDAVARLACCGARSPSRAHQRRVGRSFPPSSTNRRPFARRGRSRPRHRANPRPSRYTSAIQLWFGRSANCRSRRLGATEGDLAPASFGSPRCRGRARRAFIRIRRSTLCRPQERPSASTSRQTRRAP